jgi:DNA-3-methyladenine glycosylase II
MALLPITRSPGQLNLYGLHCRRLRITDPILDTLIGKIGPCVLSPRRDYFATLCDSIVSQQLSAKAAATIYDRFVTLFPARRPRPHFVLSLKAVQFRAVGLSVPKMGYIKDLASGFMDGRVQTGRIARHTNEEIIAALCSIKGIGRWTAEMFLIFALNRLDVLPVDDLGIQKAVQRWYGLRTPPNPAKLRVIAKPWTPYESIACWYLWQSLRL